MAGATPGTHRGSLQCCFRFSSPIWGLKRAALLSGKGGKGKEKRKKGREKETKREKEREGIKHPT